jgi:transcription-repair coupling factor (superfamily II helicase)
MVPPDTVLSEIARKRLAAIREFSELGAGFRIAALDLELRGAGNLLGGQQSGHIEAVGLDLYVKLLEQTILELKGEAPPEAPRAQLHLKLDLRLPEDLVPEVHQRLSLYKRVSQVRSGEEVERLREEVRDRYGPLPPEAESLLRYAAVRLRAEALGVQQVDLVSSHLHLRLAEPTPIAPSALLDWVRRRAGAAFSPQGVLKLPLEGQEALPALEQALESLEGLAQRTLAARPL